MAEKLQVKEDAKLLEFLFLRLSGWSKKKVKERLKGASVAVNGEVTTKHDFAIHSGDVVEVGVVQKSFGIQAPIRSLEILYQDKEIIAINKPAGLLSVGTTQESKNHALYILRNQLSRKNNAVKIWPVHRLDRDTSGVVLFATSKETREKVMSKWSESEKLYLAIVNGQLKEEKGTINEPLRLDEKEYKVHVGHHPYAKPAITHYALKQSTEKHALLEVSIETGRQHQIRAHMAWLGHSIVGDERYGTKGLRMGLHAKKLTIIHPIQNKAMSFEVDAPREFYALLT